ncbi:MAG: glycosyltransferase family 4 protein [Actinobacteria bacterium]|nr:glycosyltransferase family 4 protein [Actinomycetota bacterium]
MEKRIRIAFISAGDPGDKTYSSGVYHYMGKALENNVGEVDYLGPVSAPIVHAGKAIRAFTRRLLHRNYDYLHTLCLARSYAQAFNKKLAAGEYDIIFAPEASTEIALLETDIPVVYESDATFALMVEYYDFYRDLMRTSLRQGHWIERAAISRAAACIFPAHWTAASAIEDYGADPLRVFVVPFGANIDEDPPYADAVRALRPGPIRLLLVGVDWERKGGPIAFETLLELERMGVAASLTVCGCRPPENLRHPRLRVIPYLDKNVKEHARELARLYMDADFLLLPSRAEAFAFVIPEASAFGLPVLARATGGLPEAVQDGVNGYVLAPEARGREYASLIRAVITDEDEYLRLRASSRRHYEERLNWNAWAKDVGSILHSCISRRA